MNKMFFNFFISLMFISFHFAQEIKKNVFDHNFASKNEQVIHLNDNSSSINSVNPNWVLVDTLGRSLMSALALLNPIAYDPYSNIVALVHGPHSTYSTSNGNLWYNYSKDAGQTWKRGPSLSNGYLYKAHYPSMCLFNPNSGTINEVIGVSIWSVPTPIPPFLYLRTGYSTISPIEFGIVTDDTLINSFGSLNCWTDNKWVYWTGNDLEIFRTTDFISIDRIRSPYFVDTEIHICLGGTAKDSNTYIGLIGNFVHPDSTNPIKTGFYPGYSKSSDYGLTWGKIEVIDFRLIPNLNRFDRLFDFIKGDISSSYSAGDINVDSSGFVHMIVSVTDTSLNGNTGTNALVEIFETESGWDGKIIYENISDNIFTDYVGMAMGQMGPCGYLAFDENRTTMACVWVADDPSSPLGLCDIFISFRSIESEWSQPINLTQTPNMNENGAHLAPTLRKNENNGFTAFVGYFYQLDYYGPTPEPLTPCGFWILPYQISISETEEQITHLNKFQLSQNFPNPFNPSTKISWQTQVAGHQSLKVYDVLGNEVATLVDEEKPAGNYEVEFKSSVGSRQLASGIYFYQLKAGSFVQTKKMILIK